MRTIFKTSVGFVLLRKPISADKRGFVQISTAEQFHVCRTSTMNKIEISVTYVYPPKKSGVSSYRFPCYEKLMVLSILSEKLTWISEWKRLIAVEGYNFLTPTTEQQRACHSDPQSQCLKITKESHSTLRAKRATFIFRVDKSS